jgi:hypothetical protein
MGQIQHEHVHSDLSGPFTMDLPIIMLIGNI